jgi:hypothetical protein
LKDRKQYEGIQRTAMIERLVEDTVLARPLKIVFYECQRNSMASDAT